MSKYIDADRLKQTIAENVYPVQDIFNSRDYGMFWTGGIEKAIDEQPTADVVEVVRCKECKYRKNEQPGMVYCPHMIGGWVNENWFCAGGEKE